MRPGSTPYLDQLGFNLVGYGCTTCIGNSGPLPDEVSAVIKEKNLVVCSVLSGNRNFEGRIQQEVRANYLASPPLVVAYALAGWITKDLTTEPLGDDAAGNPVYLKDIWPTEQELQETMLRAVNAEMFQPQLRRRVQGRRAVAGAGGARGQPVRVGRRFHLHPEADVPRRDDDDAAGAGGDHRRARARAARRQRDDRSHLSGGIDQGRQPRRQVSDREGRASRPDFNSYGARRGNHEVMVRGTFANVRLRNQMAPGTEGGWTLYQPGGELMTIYDASVEVPRRRRPVARHRRQGVRLGLVARLGGERARSCWASRRSSPNRSSASTAATW